MQTETIQESAKLKQNFGGADLMNLALDCDQTGWGLTPVLGVDVKYGKFNFGAKYEFKTNLNIENNTKKLDYPDSAEDLVGPYKHGVNTPNDIPSMLSVAASYRFLPMLKASSMTRRREWPVESRRNWKEVRMSICLV